MVFTGILGDNIPLKVKKLKMMRQKQTPIFYHSNLSPSRLFHHLGLIVGKKLSQRTNDYLIRTIIGITDGFSTRQMADESKSILRGPKGNILNLLFMGAHLQKKCEKWPQRIGFVKKDN